MKTLAEKICHKCHERFKGEGIHCEKCSTRRCYAVAGELFGHLRESLGFGNLVMFTRTWGQAAPPRAIAYQWRFNANGKQYGVEECVLFIELEHLPNVAVFAQHLSDRWKNQCRRQVEESSS